MWNYMVTKKKGSWFKKPQPIKFTTEVLENVEGKHL